jgi:hypothetical protein
MSSALRFFFFFPVKSSSFSGLPSGKLGKVTKNDRIERAGRERQSAVSGPRSGEYYIGGECIHVSDAAVVEAHVWSLTTHSSRYLACA